ncbi:MotA/TolQ/ExbB proton channel family protein [Chlamydiifrater volucris]|uniref:MotA/TolQ/ExbB proton channel family protein n=1 Tax=Chlamydiifrater volucris TaxID=2681470 RepID=UPI001BCC0DC3|nr:MotA/TolQ/ExbB proton channel family protein [Chlamydiifrater volucris]
MILLAQNPVFYAYKEAGFFGKAIFLLLLLISVFTWIILQQKITVQQNFRKSGRNLKEFLIKNRNTPLSLDIHPEISPFADLYYTLKRGTLELLDKNRAASPDKGPVLSSEDILSLENLFGVVMPKYRSLLGRNNFIPATAISVAPFLGLLGTVWGILEAFSGMGTSNGETLMAGIATALGTTVAGLLVAAPSLITYNYLKAQENALTFEIEQTAYLLLNAISVKYRQNTL